MLQNYQEVRAKVKALSPRVVSVAVAQDEAVLEAVKMAMDEGLAKPILIGDEQEIKVLAAKVGLPESIEVVHQPDQNQAALMAVRLVHEGKAQVLMKGLVNSSDFLKAVLNKEYGLRTGRMLSHLAVFEIPGQKKLAFHTDGGMNIAPGLEEKAGILTNALQALHAMGIKEPKVALLTANEQVNPKMQATMDAQALMERAARKEFPHCIMEGPISLDIAISPESAHHKGISSSISGDTDLFLVHTIETGNVFGKALIYYAGAKMAGLVLGAAKPVVMTSRSETAEGKLNSLALACLIA